MANKRAMNHNCYYFDKVFQLQGTLDIGSDSSHQVKKQTKCISYESCIGTQLTYSAYNTHKLTVLRNIKLGRCMELLAPHMEGR